MLFVKLFVKTRRTYPPICKTVWFFCCARNPCDLTGPSKGSLPEEAEEEGQDEADDNTGHNGEIEAEPVPLDKDVPW
jgi:hypothetical protein